jgi:two-component system phosphate regulon sensor histidine kinase PhoR
MDFNRPYDTPPNLNGIWGALLFNVYRAQRQERVVQAEMVGLIDRAQSSLVALNEAVVLIDDLQQIEWCNPAAQHLLGISLLDRGTNVLGILRQPSFIEYFNHIDQAPDGIKLKSSILDDHYVQIKLTPLVAKVYCWSLTILRVCIIWSKCVKTLSIIFHMSYAHH